MAVTVDELTATQKSTCSPGVYSLPTSYTKSLPHPLPLLSTPAGDIKPENVLVFHRMDADLKESVMHLKISDFGLTRDTAGPRNSLTRYGDGEKGGGWSIRIEGRRGKRKEQGPGRLRQMWPQAAHPVALHCARTHTQREITDGQTGHGIRYLLHQQRPDVAQGREL